MEFEKYNLITDNFQLYFCKVNDKVSILLKETLPFLSDFELEKFQQFKSETRKAEWLQVRLMLKEILKENYQTITYNLLKKPFLCGINISISHTQSRVGVILSEKKNVGLDIETVSTKIAKIASKFMSDFEFETVEKTDLVKLTLYWSAKEALFKIYGKGKLDFKKNIRILPFQLFSAGFFDAEIILDNFTAKYKMQYQLFENLEKVVSVWCCQ